jgi:hypothetical protein
MNGFIVAVDSNLSIEQRGELARQIAELSGVTSVENVQMLLRGLNKTFTDRLQLHWANAIESEAGLYRYHPSGFAFEPPA